MLMRQKEITRANKALWKMDTALVMKDLILSKPRETTSNAIVTKRRML